MECLVLAWTCASARRSLAVPSIIDVTVSDFVAIVWKKVTASELQNSEHASSPPLKRLGDD